MDNESNDSTDQKNSQTPKKENSNKNQMGEETQEIQFQSMKSIGSKISHMDEDFYAPKKKFFAERKPSFEDITHKKPFYHDYKKSFVHRKFNKNLNEIVSGVTIALAQIPEAIAFSLLAFVSPIMGLKASFLFGLITAFIGGRPGMISGAAGALAVVQGPIVEKYGQNFLLWCMIGCGIIQILIGILKGTKLIRFVSQPVLIGFLNALGIIIFKSQIQQFREACGAKTPQECDFISGKKLLYMIIMCILSFFAIYFIPMIPKIGKQIPGALIVLTVCTLINYFWAKTKTVGDMSSVKGSFPTFYFPEIDEFSFSRFLTIVEKSIELSVVGVLESLMTAQIIAQILKSQANLKAEAIAQGVSNFVCGWTNSLGGGALLGQSKINVLSGGIKRLSTLSASLTILIVLLAASKIIEQIPLASLTGLMFLIAYETFFWKSFVYLNKMRISEVAIMLLVIAIALILDLAIAVIIGVVLQALMYVWWKAFDLHSKTKIEIFDEEVNEEQVEDIQKTYIFKGELFFASIKSLLKRFRYNHDPNKILIDAKEMRILDFSGCEALSVVQQNYKDLNKKLIVINLDERSELMVRKSNLLDKETFFQKTGSFNIQIN